MGRGARGGGEDSVCGVVEGTDEELARDDTLNMPTTLMMTLEAE